MKFYLKILLLIILIPLTFSNLLSETKTSLTSGSWNNPAIWSPAGVPITDDDVIIKSGTIITIDSNTDILKSIIIESGAILQGDGNGWFLNIGNGIGNDFTNEGILSATGTNYLIVRLNSNSEWAGSGSFNCTNIDLNGNILSFSSGGNVTINLSGSPDPFLNPGSVIAGIFTTFNYNGTSEQFISGDAISIFNSLTINNPTGVTIGANTTINGTLNLNTGFITTNSYAIIISSTGSVTRLNGYINGNLQIYRFGSKGSKF